MKNGITPSKMKILGATCVGVTGTALLWNVNRPQLPKEAHPIVTPPKEELPPHQRSNYQGPRLFG